MATLQAIANMAPLNASSARCYRIIAELCGRYLNNEMALPMSTSDGQPSVETSSGQPNPEMSSWATDEPVGESAQTQINNVFSMMWPNVPPMEAADEVMGDDAGWMEFLRAGSADDWTEPAV